MATCLKKWTDARHACERASGVMDLDFGNSTQRVKLCKVPECQNFFATARHLQAAGCLETVDELIPSAAWEHDDCVASPQATERRVLASQEAAGSGGDYVPVSSPSTTKPTATYGVTSIDPPKSTTPTPTTSSPATYTSNTSPLPTPTTPTTTTVKPSTPSSGYRSGECSSPDPTSNDVVINGTIKPCGTPDKPVSSTPPPTPPTPSPPPIEVSPVDCSAPQSTNNDMVIGGTVRPCATTKTPVTTTPVTTTPATTPPTMPPAPPIPVNPDTPPPPTPPPYTDRSPSAPTTASSTTLPPTTSSSDTTIPVPTLSSGSGSGSSGASFEDANTVLSPPVVPLPSPETTPLLTAVAPAVSPVLPVTAKSESGLSTGMIVAISSGAGVFLLVAIYLLGVWMRRKCHRHATKDDHEELSNTNVPVTPVDKEECVTNYTSNAPTAPTTVATTTQSSNTRPRYGGQGYCIPLSEIKMKTPLTFASGSTKVWFGTYQDRNVAIKKLFVLTPGAKDQARAIETELAVTGSLIHPRIVTFIGATVTDNNEWMMVSERMEGGDLRTFLDDHGRRFPSGFTEQKILIALHIAEALAYLHAHRPAFVRQSTTSRDVLLTESPFIAKLYNFRAPPPHNALMDPRNDAYRWAAPEILRQDTVGKAADIFSFGVILSELDTNELPYNSEDTETTEDPEKAHADLLKEIMHGRMRPHLSEDTYTEMGGLATRCLSYDAASRPCAERVVEEIQNILLGRDGIVTVRHQNRPGIESIDS